MIDEKISQIRGKSIELRCNDILLVKDDVSNSKKCHFTGLVKYLSVIISTDQYLTNTWEVLEDSNTWVLHVQYLPSTCDFLQVFKYLGPVHRLG